MGCPCCTFYWSYSVSCCSAYWPAIWYYRGIQGKSHRRRSYAHKRCVLFTSHSSPSGDFVFDSRPQHIFDNRVSRNIWLGWNGKDKQKSCAADKEPTVHRSSKTDGAIRHKDNLQAHNSATSATHLCQHCHSCSKRNSSRGGVVFSGPWRPVNPYMG